MPLINLILPGVLDGRLECGIRRARAGSFVAIIRAVFICGGCPRAPRTGERRPDIVNNDFIGISGNERDIFCGHVSSCDAHIPDRVIGITQFLNKERRSTRCDASDGKGAIAVRPDSFAAACDKRPINFDACGGVCHDAAQITLRRRGFPRHGGHRCP